MFKNGRDGGGRAAGDGGKRSSLEHGLDLGPGDDDDDGSPNASAFPSSHLMEDPLSGDNQPKAFRDHGEVEAGAYRSLAMDSPALRCVQTDEPLAMEHLFSAKERSIEPVAEVPRERREAAEAEGDLLPRLPQPPFRLTRTHRYVRDVRPTSLLMIIQNILQFLEVDFLIEKAKAKFTGNMISERGWFSFVARAFSLDFRASSMAVELQFRQGDRILFEGFQRAFFDQLHREELTICDADSGSSRPTLMNTVNESMQYFESLSRDASPSSMDLPPPPPMLSGDPLAFGRASESRSSEPARTSSITAESLKPLCEMLASGYEDIAEEAVAQLARLSLDSANHAALRSADVIPHLASLITQPSGPVVSTLAALTLMRTMKDADCGCIEKVLREAPDVVPALLRLCSATVRPSEMAVRRSSLQALCELVKRGEGAKVVTECGGEKVFRSIAESCENSALRECAQNAVSLLHHTGTIA